MKRVDLRTYGVKSGPFEELVLQHCSCLGRRGSIKFGILSIVRFFFARLKYARDYTVSWLAIRRTFETSRLSPRLKLPFFQAKT